MKIRNIFTPTNSNPALSDQTYSKLSVGKFFVSGLPQIVSHAPQLGLKKLSQQAAIVELPLNQMVAPFKILRAFQNKGEAPKKLLLASDPYLMKAIYEDATVFQKGGDVIFDPVIDVVGNKTVFTAEGKTWSHRRRIAGKFFTSRHVASLAPQFSEEALSMVENWKQNPKKIDLNHEMHRVTLNILLKSLFSLDLSDDDFNKLYDSMNSLFKEMLLMSLDYTGVVGKLVSFFQTVTSDSFTAEDDLFKKLKSRYKYSVSKLNKIVYKMIHERIQLMRDEPENVPNDLFTKIIHGFLENVSEEVTDDDLNKIRNEVLVYIFAGHETSANTLTSTLTYILQKPEVYQKIKTEMTANQGVKISKYSDLADYKYTLQTLFESMRMCPAIYVSGRKVKEDFTFETKDQMTLNLPKESVVIFSQYTFGRDERYWNNPDEFIPERHIIDRKKRTFHTNEIFSPFGFGPHRCVGEGFAMVEMVMILRAIFENTDLEMHSSSRPKDVANITLGKKGVFVNVK